jgi:hypothetical protein
MWRVIGSSTQESDPSDDWVTRMPNPRADPSLHRNRKLSKNEQEDKKVLWKNFNKVNEPQRIINAERQLWKTMNNYDNFYVLNP